MTGSVLGHIGGQEPLGQGSVMLMLPINSWFTVANVLV